MTKALSLQELRGLSDDELVAWHDRIAQHTAFGPKDFLDELRRREVDRAVNASQKLARRAFWLAAANSVLALVSAATAVVGILCR